jgi:hypothetical protein
MGKINASGYRPRADLALTEVLAQLKASIR